MPEIARFCGIVVYMFAKDHAPPHIHARHGEYIARLSIEPGEVLDGELPRRALRLVQAWIELRQDGLRRNWAEAQTDNPCMRKLDPLE